MHHTLDLIQSKSLKYKHNLSVVEIDTVMSTNVGLPKLNRCDPELRFAELKHYFLCTILNRR